MMENLNKELKELLEEKNQLVKINAEIKEELKDE